MKKLMMSITVALTVGAQAYATPLFNQCFSCHGKTGEKKALAQSKIIKEMSEAQIVEALTGYQNGTYGGKLKGVMKGKVTTLSKEDIQTLAQTISSFK